MYRAIRLNHYDQDEAQQMLGCDPCEKTGGLDRLGEPAIYLFTRDSPMVLARKDIVAASILPTLRNGEAVAFLLVLTLSDSGMERMGAYVAERDETMTVNEVGEKLAGANPLMLSYDQYIAGRFGNEQDARPEISETTPGWKGFQAAGRSDAKGGALSKACRGGSGIKITPFATLG